MFTTVQDDLTTRNLTQTTEENVVKNYVILPQFVNFQIYEFKLTTFFIRVSFAAVRLGPYKLNSPHN